MPGEGVSLPRLNSLGELRHSVSMLTLPSAHRPQTGDSERLLEDGLGAEVSHDRHVDEPEGEEGGKLPCTDPVAWHSPGRR